MEELMEEEKTEQDEQDVRSEAMKERRKSILGFANKNFIWIVYIILIILLIINVQIRTLPMQTNSITGNPGLWDVTTNSWTLGPDLDPFFFLRWAKTIVANGSLPEVDMMRYYPIGYHTSGETRLLPYSIAYLHYFFTAAGIGPGTVEYAAILLPVIFSVITAIAFFLLVRKIFEGKGKMFSNVTALISVLFFITLPSLLPRTIAGIPEKESMGFTFMFLAFYFFLSAWKSKRYLALNTSQILGWNVPLAFFAGLFTALMGLVWGGVIFIYITIAIAAFITLLIGRVSKREAVSYWVWLISSMLFWIPLTTRMGIRQFAMSSTSGTALIVGVLMIMHLLVLKHIPPKTFKKVPSIILTFIISIVLLLIVSSIFLGPTSLFRMGGDIISKLSQPYVSRVSYTVAENKQPYYSDWRASMGPLIFNIPIFFWMFFIGSILIFREVVFKYKYRTYLIVSYIYFLIALIFSRSSPNDILNGETATALFLYLSGYIVLIGTVCYVGYKRWKENEGHIFPKFEYIFVFSLVFVGIIAGRSAIRLLMVLVAIAVIPLSYLIVNACKSAINKRKEEVLGLLLICLAIMSIAFGFMILNYQYQSVKITGANHIPNSYTWQWQKAMGWVRDNTPQDAVFGHWWDYGYWVQTLGERATMLDGGNSIPYWNYLMGRHGLTAETEEEALELFYSHNLTYFLIDSSEIGKYAAYSSIGSDEEYDRLSWIGTFQLDDSQTIETRNGITLIYTGGVALDEDLIINESGNEIFLPARSSGVGAMVVPVVDDNFQQPSVIIVYGAKQYNIPLRYLYFDGKLKDYGSGIEATAYIFPKFEDGKGYRIQGSAMFLSPRNMGALWVKMYLLNQTDNFELVHVESSEVVKNLRAQGLPSQEIIYYRGIQGPIKIWEIKYTGEEEVNPEYLLTNYPDYLSGRINQ
jgi:asparagine N-glycosylation enzyme membrane subunit Stt3